MNKFNYNFHTHTKRCGHAVGEDEEYVLEAIKAGIQVLGFSDHVPYKYHISPTERMKVEELDGYIDSVKALKEKYKDQIDIRLGLEIEYFIDDIDELSEYVSKVDYVIIGQHYGSLPNGFDTYVNASDEDTLEYARIVENGLDSQIASYLAHPDLFMFAKEEWNDACVQASHIIARAAERNHAVLELNMGGIRRKIQHYKDGDRYRYPVKQFWDIVKQYDVDIVVGVDAHEPSNFNDSGAYEDLYAFIDEVGLNPLIDFDIKR